MDEFPTEEEQFELMYDDELELLREQEEKAPAATSKNTTKAPTQRLPRSPKLSRKSLEFTVQPTKSGLSTSGNGLDDSFDNDFSPLVTETETSNFENARKRTVEELFGDIDDIVFETNLPKKQKFEEVDEHAAERVLIDQIVELRKQARERQNPELRKTFTVATDRDEHNLSYSLPRYLFVGVKRHDGERVYVRCHSDFYEKEERERIIKEINTTGVLGDAFKNTWKEAEALINRKLDSESQSMEVQVVGSSEPIDQTKDLWVERYKPRKYFELLSDESTNRIMLRWMKLWDKIVFNRKPRVKIPKPNEADPKKKYFQKLELNTELDEHGRPQHKVALLCGPPGLGKTTLAHMVAKHAGYNVVEINASDDRSTEAFKTSLENATQMRSVIDQEKRPNCLVFDEIDGAPQSSIDYLVKFVNGTATKNKKGKKSTASILKRPIICICNDVYVPALRPLRQIAFVVNFPQTSSPRLAERLMEIAKRQQVKTDMGALLALAEKAHNDIRSCLSILHFYKSQSKPMTLSEVYKSNIGQKDMQKGLFSVWNDIFQIHRSKMADRQQRGQQYDDLKIRTQKVLGVVNAFGDFERLSQGVFENFPNMDIKDSTMTGTCRALEWFCFTDVLNKQIYSSQNYSLGSYLQYAFVIWHFTFSSIASPKLQYPSAGYEARTKRTRQKAIISEMMKGMQPAVRSFVQPISLTLDVIPLLSVIVVPHFRPVNLHLFTQEEKKCLENVVSIMIDYNLNYIQERTPEGTYVFKLDPDIDEIASLANRRTNRRKILSYSNKQVIAREIEVVKMRRFETAAGRAIGSIPQPAKGPQPGPASAMKSPNLPNHLQTLKPKAAVKSKTEPAITKDFFGRIITKETPENKAGPELHNDIWFQYKQGYSNAVRKKILISALK